MLDTDYYTLEKIQEWYKNRTIIDHIYRIRHYNRWIQISTPIEDSNVHYEYIQGHVELHFEGEDTESSYRHLIDHLIQKCENNELFVWENWGDYGYRCRYAKVINSIEELKNTLEYFFELFDKWIKEVDEQNEQQYNLTLPVNDILSSQEANVDICLLNLTDVLQLPLSIPDYQRIYCWEERNVKCLLEDIYAHLEGLTKPNSPYRLGTIILHQYEGKYDIIDGQQRLVTMALLLLELGVKSALLEEKFSSKKSHEYIAYNKHLIEVFCRKKAIKKTELSNKILNNIQFSVLLLKNTSIDLAYTFFSTHNSRGVSLTDYDLLKAHHLRYIPQAFEQQSIHAATKWNRMIEDGRIAHNSGEIEDYATTLDTYIYRLRKWMRRSMIDDSNDNYRIKREYEAAPIIEEIPPFGEQFNFYEPIQGGSHFFTYVEQHLNKFKLFSDLEEIKILHYNLSGGSFQWYRDVIEAICFGYFLKFGEYYLPEAMLVIMRILIQHRYSIGRANKASVWQFVSESNLIMIIDQATSPTFFLAEARNLAKDLSYPARQDMTPIQRQMRNRASNISKRIGNKIAIDSFKNLNL